MQFNKLQLTLILGLYYIDKTKNIEHFIKKFNVYFGTSISAQTILFELAKYKNIDPANNQILNSSNFLYKQIWDEYILAERIADLKNLYKMFVRGDFSNRLNGNSLVDCLEIEDSQAPYACLDTPVEKPSKLQNTARYSYPRSKEVLQNALSSARYLCEANCDTKLFLRKNGTSFYTEGHHLIPLEFQDYFEYSLDVEANVLSLCPNCHKLLHYGYDKENTLKRLYEARIDRLKKCNLDIDFTSLLLMYR